MQSTPRIVFAGLLGVGLAFAAGCGSKVEPGQPNPDVSLEPQPAPQAVAVYELDPAKHVLPAGPVSGALLGEKVTAEVRLEGRLVFRKPDGAPGNDWNVMVDLPPEAFKGEPYRLVVGPKDANQPTVTVTYPQTVELPRLEFDGDPAAGAKPKVVGWEQPLVRLGHPKGCSLTLELGKRANGKVPGKVYLALPAIQTKSHPELRDFLAGTFEAESLRQPDDPPGSDDRPFVKGNVTVRGASPGATLVAGYVANPSPEVFAFATADLTLAEPGQPGKSVRMDYDKPRVTVLSAGDGKDTPSRYEHSRLTPGRYFVFAGLKGGQWVGKWVGVTAGGAHTADLVIDASQTGGLEVTVPLEVLGKVRMVPAEEPGQPAISQLLFEAIALQCGWEHDIVARKAVYKGLAPGRYEVRAGAYARVVEVVAGKTAELDIAKSPEPKKEPEPKTNLPPIPKP